MLRECDYSQALLEQVNQAISDKTPLVIQGSNSKAFLGRPVTGQTLDVRCHRGIVNYDPTELVITARAGTPLVAIEAALESAGQIGFAPIFPDICYHLTHYRPAAADIPVASDNPTHYADAIRYNARTPLQGSLLPLTRLVWV